MKELSEILKDDFINLSQVAKVMQPEKESRIAANAVRKRVQLKQKHPQEEIEKVAPKLALLKHKIEVFLEKSMQNT